MTTTNETFAVGDQVSWNVGSDIYAGTIVKRSKARIVAEHRYLGPVTFTLRPNGQWRPQGSAHGLLRYGGSERLDPCF